MSIPCADVVATEVVLSNQLNPVCYKLHFKLLSASPSRIGGQFYTMRRISGSLGPNGLTVVMTQAVAAYLRTRPNQCCYCHEPNKHTL